MSRISFPGTAKMLPNTCTGRGGKQIVAAREETIRMQLSKNSVQRTRTIMTRTGTRTKTRTVIKDLPQLQPHKPKKKRIGQCLISYADQTSKRVMISQESAKPLSKLLLAKTSDIIQWECMVLATREMISLPVATATKAPPSAMMHQSRNLFSRIILTQGNSLPRPLSKRSLTVATRREIFSAPNTTFQTIKPRLSPNQTIISLRR
mmetsp:Transcript_12186/g.25611  ORF Transcript_12186/g.25611 Transcript_12186/m.25611 type:complete len:206 (-) Transcript_12186:1082-1699(-)